MHDLIVDRHIREPLDGDARALTDTFAERDATAGHVGTGAQGCGTLFEFVTQHLERCNELVLVRRFGIWLGRRLLRHAVDCTTGPYCPAGASRRGTPS